MKKILYPAFFIGMLSVSCQKTDINAESENAIKSSLPADSEIALAENQLGVKLFKKEVTFTDDAGLNKVVFRFGAKDEKAIDEYLKQYTVKITPVTDEEYREIKKSVNPISSSSEQQSKTVGYSFSGIAIDFVSKTLQKGAKGYGLEITPIQVAKNARLWPISNFESHSWMPWPEAAKVNAKPFDKLYVEMWRRWRWWWFAYGYLNGGNQAGGTIKNWMCDGQWKARVNIEYPTGYEPSVKWIDVEAGDSL